MGYFQVRYNSRVVSYDCRAFLRLTTGQLAALKVNQHFAESDAILLIGRLVHSNYHAQIKSLTWDQNYHTDFVITQLP